MTAARRPGWRLAQFWPLAVAAGAGLLAALGQAPWGLWGATLAGLAGMLALIGAATSPRAAFGCGWWAGFAMFALAMSWIVEPFFIEPERHAWMAPFALILLPGGLALFWGAGAALAAWLAPAGRPRLPVAILTLTGAEALRGWLFTGFPWAMPGHVWIATPLAQLAALIGPLGLTALTLALAAGLAVVMSGWDRRAALAGALVAATLGGGWWWGQSRLAAPMPPDREPQLRLVQANADQALKWQRDWAEIFFHRHLDLTAAPPEDGAARPDLVIWPETAVPFYLESPGDGLTMAADAAVGAMLITGIQRRAIGPYGDWRYFNSLAAIDAEGVPFKVHDKHHLVPFGEYVPLLGRFADRPGLEFLSGFASQALLGYTPGSGPAVLDLGDLGQVLPLICYEAVFPRHLRTPERPDWLLQLTNDAWFGQVSGPFQHLALARLRAIEQGLPMIRVANTGVSAVIDARGRVLQELGLGQMGVIDAALPGALPATLYARTGDAPWHLALALLLGLLVWRARRIDTPAAGA